VTETPPARVLPFAEFLAVLRGKGFDVGVREHLLMARLLERWPGTEVREFGDSIAALLARSEVEAEEIRRLFADTYSPTPQPRPRPEPPPPPDPWRVVRRYAWLTAMAGAVVLLVLVLRVPPPPSPPPPETPQSQTPAPPPTAVAPIRAPEPMPPASPPAPTFVIRQTAALTGGGLFLLAFAGFWALKVRDARRRWSRDAWASALAGIPGPYHFQVVLRDPIARLPRIDVEDTATILSRAFTAVGQRQQLDVRRTLVRTLQRGRLPTFVFRPRRAMRTIIVLHDLAPEMRMWRAKVDRFVIDLQRQGVPLERYYFDGDIRLLSKTPHRATLSLDSLLRRRPDVALLVVSSGSQLAALLDHDDSWVRALADREWRTWLTPVSDTRLWPPELTRLPFPVWPMTRTGLLQAARALAEPNTVSASDVRMRERTEVRVTLDGVERLKRLASLVPHPTTELLEALRRRFAPDVSDAVIVQLLRDSAVSTAPVVRLPDAEVARCLTAVRFESPRFEADVRRFLLGVLRDSEPTAGSAAHLRWEIASALHRRALADLGEGDRHAADVALAHHANGPMWEEVRQLTQLLPSTAARERAGAIDIAATSPHPRKTEQVAPPSGAPVAAGSPGWVWPGLRELAPAAVAAFVVLIVSWSFRVLPVQALAHVANAYALTYTSPSGATPYGRLELARPSGASATAPALVDVYKGETAYRTAVDLSTGSATLPIADASDLGSHYQLRARLPGGNLALSNWVWVPGREVPVLIDAQPWARVTITGTHVPAEPQVTPFVALLEPGSYSLHLENGGLTPATDRPITVNDPGAAGSATTQTVQVTMPGFNAEQTAQTLSAPAQAK
jgi:hypothetical protein